MLRVILEPLALFLSPFAAYALFLLFFGAEARWTGRRVWTLALAGVALALASVLWVAVTSERRQGAYTPARIENGKLVPGHME